MENKCTNMEIGIHLHAYEISALNEKMTADFETHLLSCKSCFKSVQEFENESMVLKNDNLILGEINSAALINNKSFWQSFTAPTCVLALIIILMIYPTFLGLSSMASSSVRSVNSIILVSVRSADNNFSINHENDIVLSFRYPDCDIQKEYQIEIYSEKNLSLPSIHLKTLILIKQVVC